MVELIYDGSFEGLFTAIFESYWRKLEHAKISRAGAEQGLLFGEQHVVHTDPEQAQRVWKKLQVLIGWDGLHTIRQVYLSELPEMEQVILGCVRYALQQNQDVLSDYGHADVLRLRQVAKMVHREKHRMEAFVRFQLTKDDLFYAVIDPDFNVLPLILPHFERRYSDQRWLIYDQRRKYGIYYDLNSAEFVDLTPDISLDRPSMEVLDEAEPLYQLLWNDYFHHTNIPSRRNTKLHLQHVPKRYWKYLTEKRGF
jgi:probable DNA metabolism protein